MFKSSPRKPTSVVARVLAMVGLAVIVCLAGFSFLIQRSIKHHFAALDAAELQTVYTAIAHRLTERDHHNSMLSSAVSGHNGVFFQVRNNRNNIIYHSNMADASYLIENTLAVKKIDADTLSRWKANHHDYRGAVKKFFNGQHNYTIAVAIKTDFHDKYLYFFTLKMWGFTCAISAIIMFFAWAGIYQGLAPLRRLSQHIAKISSSALDTRIEAKKFPIELKTLAVSFNSMLEKIEKSFNQLSHFSDDIAHELRTPIANLTTQTEVALGKTRKPQEYQELLYSNLEEYTRLKKMIANMLLLAKTDNGLLTPHLEKINIYTEILKLYEYFQPWAEDKNITIDFTGENTFCYADKAMLKNAIFNVISNAVHYTPSKNSISIALQQQKSGVKIMVKNTGTEIPKEALSSIFGRFYRTEFSRQEFSEGAGLGLAIAKSFIEAHKGRIIAESGNQNVIFTIEIPVAGG